MRAPDVVVIGGGVMGCAIALRLAERGARTAVLERSAPGSEASSVAAGILAPRIEYRAGTARAIGIDSLERHARLARQLADDHGIDVGFRVCGAMRIALDEAEAGALRALDPDAWIDRAELARREPAITGDSLGALDLPDEAQCEPPLLLRALAIAAERAGAILRSGTTVRAVRVERDRVLGVIVDEGTIDAAHVVVAAGAWTSIVPGLPARLTDAVRPIRGQLVHADLRPPIARRVLFGAGGYMVPRADGRIVCGATMEDVGFVRDVTLGGLGEVIARATRLVPALERASFVRHAVSFRPSSPDDLPLVGPAGPEGLWLATGHYRNGILLAPITADVIADLVIEGRTSIAHAAAMSPARLP